MSGIALFGLKYPSLLQFDKDGRQGQSPIVAHNLKHLYGVEVAPSDTSFRERLDPVSPEPLQRGINRLVAQLQRGKVLECYRYLEDYTLIAIDGTEYFSSHEVHCENCCVKEHRDGSKTYYHQMLAAVVVNPTYSQVFPIMLEPIRKTDGARKNDCEHSALKRLLVNLRKAHPHIKLMVTLDGLYADGVIIQLLQELDIRFIITANEKDVKYLYEFYHATKKQTLNLIQDKRDTTLSFINQIPLNATHPDLNVNMLTVEETIYQPKKNRERHLKFAWLMDIEITLKNAPTLMTGGRARWRVENETFNTLKNQGYYFEHNFGHGNQNLNVVMAYLMFTAFLIDQIQAFCCKHFTAALKHIGRMKYLWENMRSFFKLFFIRSWEDFYAILATPAGQLSLHAHDLIPLNTS